MTISEFLSIHGTHGTDPWYNYCEAIITSDGTIYEARPSHMEWCIRYACHKLNISRKKLESLMPITCNPLHWLTDFLQLTCTWYDYILTYPGYTQNSNLKTTIQQLKEHHLVTEKAVTTIDITSEFYTQTTQMYKNLSPKSTDWCVSHRLLEDQYIIFLDFDGVLNHIDCELETDFLSDAILTLNTLFLLYNAKIVISSSWRTCYTMQQLSQLLRLKGIYCDVIDKTPIYIRNYDNKKNNTITLSEMEFYTKMGPEDGPNKEVLDYVKTHQLQHYVILDDLPFSNPILHEHQILTCFYDKINGGLHPHHLEKIYNILGKPNENR